MSLNFRICHYLSKSLSILTFLSLFNILKASVVSQLFNVFSSTIVFSVFLTLRSNITSFPIYHSGPVNPFCLLNVFPETLFLSLPREIVSNGKSPSVFNQLPLQRLASQDVFVAHFINLLFLKANLILQWNYPIPFSSKTTVKICLWCKQSCAAALIWLELVHIVSLKPFLPDFLLQWAGFDPFPGLLCPSFFLILFFLFS